MDTSIEQARFNMIQQQIRPWNLHDDRVLEVMDAVPRERFAPDAYRSLAYADIEIPIGAGGQAMLSPKVVGRMLQALEIKGEDRILEIGTGTGYVTACLARLGSQVVSLEIDPELATQARETLEALEVRRLDLRVGDALAGPVEGNPFDVIAVTGSLPDDEALTALQSQLAMGGRLFAILGEEPVMEAVLVTRIAANGFSRKGLFETCAPALVNVPEPERFVF
jgi:protein-L-isoaspartate(D-aspartate) O-methyltransferase